MDLVRDEISKNYLITAALSMDGGVGGLLDRRVEVLSVIDIRGNVMTGIDLLQDGV